MARLKIKNNPERIMHTLHRITGLLLVAYFTAHAILVGLVFAGNETAIRIEESVQQHPTLEKVILWGVAVSAVFHGLNGIRLILVEALGAGIGKPELPKPPYISTSLRSAQRKLLYIFFVLFLIGAAAATYALIVMEKVA